MYDLTYDDTLWFVYSSLHNPLVRKQWHLNHATIR
jgi:hypothetical protein